MGLARDVLASACRHAEIPAVWTEWNSEDPACPEHVHNLGSPTILVNGEDVAPGPHPMGAARGRALGRGAASTGMGDALVPAPPLERVNEAIERALGPEVV